MVLKVEKSKIEELHLVKVFITSHSMAEDI